jgi:hypothetical protein
MNTNTEKLTGLNMVAPDASPEPIKIVVRTYILFNEESGIVPCGMWSKNLTRVIPLNKPSPAVQLRENGCGARDEQFL